MKETVELRNKPKLKIILDMDGFEIVDTSEPKNSGTFSFGQLKGVELKEKRTNWFVTILSYAFSVFLDGPTGEVYKDKQQLLINTENKTLRLSLVDCDMKSVERIVKKINEKLN